MAYILEKLIANLSDTRQAFDVKTLTFQDRESYISKRLNLPKDGLSVTNGLQGLVDILGEHPSIKDYLPNELFTGLGASSGFTDIVLKELEMDIDLSQSYVPSFLAFEVQAIAAWSLIDGLLEIKNPGLSINIQFPGTAGLSGSVFGTIGIAGTDIDISISFQGIGHGSPSDFSIVAALAPGAKIDLAALLKDPKINISDPKGLDTNLAITKLVMRGEYLSKTLSLEAGISGDWSLGVGSARLTELNGSITIGKSINTTFSIAARFRLGEEGGQYSPIDIGVSSTYKGKGTGWSFNGFFYSDKGVSIEELVQGINHTFSTDIALPSAIADFKFTMLSVDFDTGSKSFEFKCSGEIPLGTNPEDGSVKVTIILSRQTGDGAFTFDGTVWIGLHAFRLYFQRQQTPKGLQSDTSSRLIAIYKNEEGEAWMLQRIAAGISQEIASYIPASLSLTLKDAFFSYAKTTTPPETAFVLGLDIAVGVDLSNIPVVGSKLPKGLSVGLDNLRLIIASRDLTASADRTDLLRAINSTLDTAGIAALPTSPNPPGTVDPNPPAAAQSGQPLVVIRKGLNFIANLNLGGHQLPMLMAPRAPETQRIQQQQQLEQRQEGIQQATGQQTTVQQGTQSYPPKPGQGALWIPIDKTVGPIAFERFGITFREGRITFLLDAALIAGKLTISLEGLAAGSPLDRFEPHFDLAGLSIAYASPTVEIGGGLLKSYSPPAEVEYEYDGFLTVRAKKLTLTALGSYAKLKTGDPSFFVYLAVDYPLGGPAWFFVMGLAAGFGYNRRLIQPTLEQMDKFPLVAQALNGPPARAQSQDDRAYLLARLKELEQWIPPEVGQYWIAVGLKFTSFRIINSFALLVFSFGDRFRIDLYGRTFIIHPPVPPDLILSSNQSTLAGLASKPYLVKVEVDIKASFVPDEGVLEARGMIKSGSYVYSPLAHIEGNFAFMSWFKGEQEGDYVFVLGGYHPQFDVPAHYPQRSLLRPLSVYYGVNSHLYVKGSLYFAFTPQTLMAGGALEAVFSDGPFDASFRVYADMLILYKPFHYDFRAGVEIHVDFSFDALFVTVHISCNVGASLHIRGPEFSGNAEVHFHGFTKTINFGSAGGPPPAIGWNEFQDSFLPAPEKVVRLSVQQGLLDTYKSEAADVWLLDPKTLQLGIDTAIPITHAFYIQQDPSGGTTPVTGAHIASGRSFGIAPMRMEEPQSRLAVYVEYLTDAYADTGIACTPGEFAFHASTKNVPGGLWGDYHASPLGKPLVEDALCGLEMKPGRPPLPAATRPVPTANLQYDTESLSDAYDWAPGYTFKPDTKVASEREDAIKSGMPRINVKALAGLVSPEDIAEINLTSAVHEVSAFITMPQTGTVA
jgi:hypothetical protein